MHDWRELMMTIMVLGLAAGLLGYGFYADDSTYWIPGVVVLVLPLIYWSRYYYNYKKKSRMV